MYLQPFLYNMLVLSDEFTYPRPNFYQIISLLSITNCPILVLVHKNHVSAAQTLRRNAAGTIMMKRHAREEYCVVHVVRNAREESRVRCNRRLRNEGRYPFFLQPITNIIFFNLLLTINCRNCVSVTNGDFVILCLPRMGTQT